MCRKSTVNKLNLIAFFIIKIFRTIITLFFFNTLAAACITGDTLPSGKMSYLDMRGSQRINYLF